MNIEKEINQLKESVNSLELIILELIEDVFQPEERIDAFLELKRIKEYLEYIRTNREMEDDTF
jgi:hypothetical protein